MRKGGGGNKKGPSGRQGKEVGGGVMTSIQTPPVQCTARRWPVSVE